MKGGCSFSVLQPPPVWWVEAVELAESSQSCEKYGVVSATPQGMSKGILRVEVTVFLLFAGEFWGSVSQQFIKFHEGPGYKEQREGKLTNLHFCACYLKLW